MVCIVFSYWPERVRCTYMMPVRGRVPFHTMTMGVVSGVMVCITNATMSLNPANIKDTMVVMRIMFGVVIPVNLDMVFVIRIRSVV